MRLETRHTLRRLAVPLALVLASAVCAALVEVRVQRTGHTFYRFLDWNLFLAWIPFGLAATAQALVRPGGRLIATLLSVLWLLFFPNAPYIVSDFVHLGPSRSVPLWYDGLMLSAFAGTGLLLGFASLRLMQQVWRRMVGPVLSWAGVVAAIGLGSVGVYLGRVFRLNSWDALLHPLEVTGLVLRQLANPFAHRWAALVIVAVAAGLLVAYAVLYGLAGGRTGVERERT